MLRAKALFLLLFLLAGCDADYLHGKKCDFEQRCLPGYVCEASSGRCLWPWEIPDGGQDGGDSDHTNCSNTPGSQNILTSVKLNGKEPPAQVEPGNTVEIEVNYELSQMVGCDNCSNQFLFGLKSPSYGHQPLLCNQAGIPPPCPATLRGSVNFALQMPFTPGSYQLMSTVAQDKDCDQAMTNFFVWMSRRAAQAASIVVLESQCPDSYAYLSGVKLNGQPSPLTITPDQKVNLEADFTASQVQTCPDCPTQLVIGLDSQPVLCQELDRLPACPASKKGKVSGEFSAPASPASYLLKYSLFTASNCQSAQDLYSSNPPARAWTAAVIIVQ